MPTGVTMCRMELKNSAEARSVASKELVREMKVPKNPQRPVEKHWSPPCLGWEFTSNSIRSSKDKMTLDNAWVRLTMAYPIHPPPYYQSKWFKMQTKVCYFSSLTDIFTAFLFCVFESLINELFTSVSFNKDACHLELLVNMNSSFKYSLT